MAGRAPAFSRFRPLFPEAIDTLGCTILGRGSPGGKRLRGRCSVDVRGLEKPSSTPVVVFTEQWPISGTKRATHTWSVLLNNFKAVSVTESGAVPPQLWR